MTVREIIRALGGPRVVAAVVGRRPAAVRNWVHDGYVPPKHHSHIIEMASGAGFQVTATDLDPSRAAA